MSATHDHTDAEGALGAEAAGATPSLPFRWTSAWRWGVVACYMMVIYALSSQTSFPRFVSAFSDKLMHFVAYGGLSALVVWALARGRWGSVTLKTVAVATLICTAYGLSDEIHQLFVPRRSYDLRDLLADATGAFVAAASVWAWSIISRGRGRNHGV